MIKMISFVIFTILTTFQIQCKQNQQSKCCQCCQCRQCCQCCNSNGNDGPFKEKRRIDDRYIYYYLEENNLKLEEKIRLTKEDINKIAKNYLRLINEADDTVKTLDDVTTDILTPKIIIQHLEIYKAINEINGSGNVIQKIIKIISIVNDDFINKKYTYENSNLKFPRCLVKHENNNCVLESHLSANLSDLYIIKLFYLLNYLFEKGFLSKENCPVTFEVCKFFNEAVTHPNFTDTIRCISVMEAYFDHYLDSNYAQQKYKNGELKYTYGSFQNYIFAEEITKCVVNELNTDQALQPHMLLLEKIIDGINRKRLGTNREHNNICHLHYTGNEITKLDRLNYYGCEYKDKFIHFASILFLAQQFHMYAFRKINNIWLNYDSYNVEMPTPVSDKFMSRLILNSISHIPNFNGDYPSYITSTCEHYDLF